MTRGEEFRKEVAKALDLAEADPIWLAMLSETCRAMDIVERLEVNVADQSLTVEGSTGQQRANPLLGELRAQRAALTKLLQALGVDEHETQSQRQSRVAGRRYGR
jgi:phage terminase small subunit